MTPTIIFLALALLANTLALFAKTVGAAVVCCFFLILFITLSVHSCTQEVAHNRWKGDDEPLDFQVKAGENEYLFDCIRYNSGGKYQQATLEGVTHDGARVHLSMPYEIRETRAPAGEIRDAD